MSYYFNVVTRQILTKEPNLQSFYVQKRSKHSQATDIFAKNQITNKKDIWAIWNWTYLPKRQITKGEGEEELL